MTFLDATSAYDVASHYALDVALCRLGSDEGFIDWARKAVAGHTRNVATAAGVSAKAGASQLGALAQGDPLSPVLWVAIADVALAHARAAPLTLDARGQPKVAGFKLAEDGETPDAPARPIGVPTMEYADDRVDTFQKIDESV